MRRIGSPTIASQMAGARQDLEEPDEAGAGLFDLGSRIPSGRGLGDRLDLDPERHRQGRVRDLVVEICLLRAELLDLAADVG